MNDELFLYLIIVVALIYIMHMLSTYTCMQYEHFADVAKTEMAQATVKPPREALIASLPPVTPLAVKSPDDLVGKTFKLFASIPKMPTYVKGETFTETPNNTFYMSAETLDPNCQVVGGQQGCTNMYIPNKQCANRQLFGLGSSPQLTLIASKYCDDPTIPFGKNNEFTLESAGGKYFLKNTSVNSFVCLWKFPPKQISVYGKMINDDKSNVAQTINMNVAQQCTNNQPNPMDDITKQKEIFVTCNLPMDNNVYLSMSPDASGASPVTVDVATDGTIIIKLQYFDYRGVVEKSYPLSICKFDVNTQKDIERITNPAGTFFVNLVCIEGTAPITFSVLPVSKEATKNETEEKIIAQTETTPLQPLTPQPIANKTTPKSNAYKKK